ELRDIDRSGCTPKVFSDATERFASVNQQFDGIAVAHELRRAGKVGHEQAVHVGAVDRDVTKVMGLDGTVQLTIFDHRTLGNVEHSDFERAGPIFQARYLRNFEGETAAFLGLECIELFRSEQPVPARLHGKVQPLAAVLVDEASGYGNHAASLC